MDFKHSGGAWKRAILIQLAIVAALAAVLKFYLPGMEKRREAAVVRERENRIQSFARTMIVEDPTRDIPSGPNAGEHPQKLLRQDSIDEVQSALGAPTSESRDFRGGGHLTWTGTDHQIEAAFDRGILYNLMYEDIHTGHGVSVYESGAYWQRF
ncbi:MAG TPA: hypothetical protein VGZ29_16770 [Terriglobia bacterium]|nr:hypothetical protein [Terriglobia bacterium]